MPVVNIETCLYSNPDFFARVTNDRTFCAGFLNGSTVCNGDSGGSKHLIIYCFLTFIIAKNFRWYGLPIQKPVVFERNRIVGLVSITLKKFKISLHF